MLVLGAVSRPRAMARLWQPTAGQAQAWGSRFTDLRMAMFMTGMEVAHTLRSVKLSYC